MNILTLARDSCSSQFCGMLRLCRTCGLRSEPRMADEKPERARRPTPMWSAASHLLVSSPWRQNRKASRSNSERSGYERVHERLRDGGTHQIAGAESKPGTQLVTVRQRDEGKAPARFLDDERRISCPVAVVPYQRVPTNRTDEPAEAVGENPIVGAPGGCVCERARRSADELSRSSAVE